MCDRSVAKPWCHSPATPTAIYMKGDCATCHIVRGQGESLGPELSDIGGRRGPDYLRKALLHPGIEVALDPDGYTGFLVVRNVMHDGREVRGTRINGDTFTIQLRDADNRYHSFRKGELKELHRGIDGSLMPSYEEAFSATEMDDLIGMWPACQVNYGNAFYYLLDRETGEFLLGSAYAKQTWAKGFDKRGRSIVLPNTEPTVEGTVVYPSLQGATNWFSPSYSPRTDLFYVAVREMGAYYLKGEAVYVPGEYFLGGGEQALTGDEAYGAIRALDAMTGNKKWEFNLHSPPWAGVLSTAGGLVFGGTNEGNVFALHARTGEALWEFQTGGAIRANPISFSIDGMQYVAIAAGNAMFVFGL